MCRRSDDDVLLDRIQNSMQCVVVLVLEMYGMEQNEGKYGKYFSFKTMVHILFYRIYKIENF